MFNSGGNDIYYLFVGVPTIEQTILFCKKADFVAERLSDNRKKRGVAVSGEMTKQERQDNVIMIIQVPLKQKTQSGSDSEEIIDKWSADCFDDISREIIETNLESESNSENKNENKNDNDNKLLQTNIKADMEAAIVKALARTNPVCICEKELAWLSIKECYGPTSIVSCTKCQKSQSKGYVWHCPECKNRNHSKGFNLCADCGAMQFQWDELNGLSLVKRDERFPIRVTLQYYQATSNGVVNDDIIANIANLLKSTQQQADFVGSLVTETNPDRPTEWIKQQNTNIYIYMYSYFLFLFADDGYDNIAKLLKDTFSNNWQSHFINFKKEGFDDEILLLLINEDDLIEVLSNDVDRNTFFQYAMRWKQSK
ncbi:hypothetical protein RFI_03655 [Reticulomyxa filosa]|uniref:Uncharacterized protein n=1 Tax=Reticulomyxa filosa TaxID=46433 RepID=X6P5Q9_RETFI|nr:hypothetical protein RFI_03655 [Reticulomyxa filosa]|eukprot:ETO33453.1 hypothetical protein RFI_03655 [Reticulomyxa filosa]